MSCPNCKAPLELWDAPQGEVKVCPACGWNESDSVRARLVIAGVLFAMVGVAGFWLGSQRVTLSDLSQQKAHDISYRVFGVCFEEVAIVGQKRASVICEKVADTAREEIFTAGVQPEEDAVRRAKEMARKAGKQ